MATQYPCDKSDSPRWAGKTQPLATVLHQVATDKVASFPSHDLFPSVMTPALPAGPEKLHVFTADTLKGIREATWEQNVAAAQWAGSWSMLEGRAPSGSPVTAVSSTDGNVYTAAWEGGVAGDPWRGWWRVRDLSGQPGTLVGAVVRKPAHQVVRRKGLREHAPVGRTSTELV